MVPVELKCGAVVRGAAFCICQQKIDVINPVRDCYSASICQIPGRSQHVGMIGPRGA